MPTSTALPPCPHGRTGYGMPHGPRIISISKRTDIPAFYLPWLLRRIERGWVDVPNPLLTSGLLAALRQHAPDALPDPSAPRLRRRAALDAALERAGWPPSLDRQLARAVTHVSLRPDDVLAVVWWSKNYAVYLRYRDRLACYPRQHFHFTINPRRDDLRWLEPDVPPLDEALRQARALIDHFGPQALTWRYDPLVFWEEDGQRRSSWDPAFFERVCRVLGPLGVRRCVTSVADPYRKVVARWRRSYPDRPLRRPEPEELAAIGEAMVALAGAWGLEVEACAEPALASVPGIAPASCIDAVRLVPERYATSMPLPLPLPGVAAEQPEHWTGEGEDDGEARARPGTALAGPGRAGTRTPPPATDRQFATRQACGCHRHVDIGDYAWEHCGYGCLYCYANPTHRFFSAAA